MDWSIAYFQIHVRLKKLMPGENLVQIWDWGHQQLRLKLNQVPEKLKKRVGIEK